MGILDDAIREHLELIRQRGPTDSEVRRLEDEAFGPPTRPDEADFPESEEARASANGVGAGEREPGEEAAAHEDVTTLLPAEEAREPEAEAPGTGLEEPTGAHVTGDVDEPEGEPVLGELEDEGPADVADAEPVAEEHPVVEEAQPELIEEEEAPGGEDATTLYDQGRGESEEMDLDLSLTEEGAPEEPPSEEPPAHEPEGAVPLEPPIESLDTVEHPFPDEITETEEPQEEAAPSDEHAVHDELAPEGEEDADGSDEGEEDVLADTPEFLKDQPEDDELWFEQGEPKDFDF